MRRWVERNRRREGHILHGDGGILLIPYYNEMRCVGTADDLLTSD
jgi:hypothetical protein